MATNRSIKAIMFADIQGYTELMGKDESMAVRIRKKFEAVTSNSVQANDGTIKQQYGDGVLVIFENTRDAVICGKRMQEEFRTGLIIPVRIGIHTGEIMEKDDVTPYGDAVNIASRIESVGIKNSILLSEKAYDDIKNTQIRTIQLDTFFFKNVQNAIKVYAIAEEGLSIPDSEHIAEYKSNLQDKPDSFIAWCTSNVGLLTISIIAIIAFSNIFFQTIIWASQIIAQNYNPSFQKLFLYTGLLFNILVSAVGCYILVNTVIEFKLFSKNRTFISRNLGVKEVDLEGLYDRANYGITEFKNFWAAVWFTYLALYIVILAQEIISPKNGLFRIEAGIIDILSVLKHFLNNLTSLFLLMCSTILTKRKSSDSTSHINTNLSYLLIILVFLITFLEIIFYVLNKNQYYDYIYLPELLSGVFSAVALGLLLGRLDSKLLNIKSWIIVALFGYVSIQPLFAYIGISQIIASVLISYALFAKSLLFLYVLWLIETKRFLYFFLKLNGIIKELEEEWLVIKKKL